MVVPLSPAARRVALTSAFLAPFFLLLPTSEPGDEPWVALSLAVLSWHLFLRLPVVFLPLCLFLAALVTTPKPAFQSLVVESLLLGTFLNTVLGILLRRIDWRAPVRAYESAWRLFALPGARGTIHARWLFGAAWVMFLLITAVRPGKLRALYLMAWAIVAIGLWVWRLAIPRWDPSRLVRTSLMVSALPALHMHIVAALAAPGALGPTSRLLAWWSLSALSVSVLWTAHEWRLVTRIRNGTHPDWVLTTEKRRGIIRRRARATYRAPARGAAVGALPPSGRATTEVLGIMSVLFVISLYLRLLMLIAGC